MELVHTGKSQQNFFFFVEKSDLFFFLIRFLTDRIACFLKLSPLHKTSRSPALIISTKYFHSNIQIRV